MENLARPGPPLVVSSKLSPAPAGTSTNFPPEDAGSDRITIGAVSIPFSPSKTIVAPCAGMGQNSSLNKQLKNKKEKRNWLRAMLFNGTVVWIISSSLLCERGPSYSA
jgi:hypothetical protein